MNIFNLFNKKTVVTIDLDETTKLVVKPTTGGVNAELTTTSGMFIRNERAFFSSCGELVNSLRLTDEKIIEKLSKAF